MSTQAASTNNDVGSRESGKPTNAVLLHSVRDPDQAEKTLEWFRHRGWLARSTGDSLAAPDESYFGQLSKLLRNHQAQSPGSGLLLIDAGLAVSEYVVNSLMALMDAVSGNDTDPFILTALSNADPDLNPFSGLDPAEDNKIRFESAGDLVALLGPGHVHEHNKWPQHLVLFSAKAVLTFSQPESGQSNVLAKLNQDGGRLLVSDRLFIHDPRRGLFDQPILEPHEQRRPVAWGVLTQRLDAWLRSDLPEPDSLRPTDKPRTLHISHSWGGGVEQWVNVFIQADETSQDLQLLSEGPQSGEGAGQRLSLYFRNKKDMAIATWWLQAPIHSTAAFHEHYREILIGITQRYGVGRVIVSSLVGHSLDALGTGLPTIQVLHDFYPQWPLLDTHPGRYLKSGEMANLNRALSEQPLLPDFQERDATSWKELAATWRETIATRGVKLVAPSCSVVGLFHELEPDWAGFEIEVIPHGLPPFPAGQEVLPLEREDGRLRLLVPGRIQQGKGRDLLLEALPELTQYAHVYLLGAGKEGEVFFGHSGVDVILQYKREELPPILARIGPQVCALLSVVPETFSYTLSEMQELDIPVVATRVGSLAERVLDGETGWLIEPNASALVEKIKFLSENRDRLDELRSRLPDYTNPNAGRMRRNYDQLCMPRPIQQRFWIGNKPASMQLSAGAVGQVQLERQIRKLNRDIDKLKREIVDRTQWAEERQRAVVQEQERRNRWVNSLNQQLDERFEELQSARQALDHEKALLEQNQARLAQLRQQYDWVLASTSWRITKPFRAGRRILRNLRQARAWNPMNWPLLISQLVRTLKTQGLKGTLTRSQLSHHKTFIPDGFEPDQVEEIGSPDPPASLPAVSEPDVSIVIPVYNKWIYTAACLRSLSDTSSRASFEVIVVDDQSSDETAEWLAAVDGLNCIRNEKNLGFIGSCNRGAAAARGNYVVMLNNDTQVLEGWLDALLETFDRFPDTGMAGARLIYPDGSLQENGGIIFNDGSGWNYGKNDEADKPEYQYVREVDYCSGACIMLRAELFRELGGFDSLYAPAYYEDTDLAFQLRARGLKVRVQPRATIVHHEGVTSGTDIVSGTKRFQAVNRKKFLERWKDELAAHPVPIANPDDRSAIRRARDHRLKGRILVIDAYTPEPDQDSGSLRLRYLLDCFINLGYGVTFFADNRGHDGSYTIDLQQAGVEVIYSPWLDSLHDFFSQRGPEFSFVMISRHYVAANYISLLERYCPDTKFIFDTVDLHYLREQRLAELEDSLPLKRVAAQTRRSELAVIHDADVTLVVSPVEKSVLERDAPEARVHVISNVHKVVGSRRSWADRKDIFFVGGYQHPPNVDAATWFVGKIWPLVRKQLPDIQFHLIGSKAPEQIRSLHGNGVQFHGFVKSLEPWLDDCRLAVAPLRYGAGIKGKVNISMSRGQPVVATQMAVEGMFVKSGKDILVAENAEDFADEIVRLYQDEQLWNEISTAGLENVRKYFSVETARLSLQELLRVC